MDEKALPQELTKSAQRSSFVEYYKDKEATKKEVNYIQEKGKKLSKICEIQFYKEQIKSSLESDNQSNVQETLNRFVDEAKKQVKSSDESTIDLYEFSMKFLSQCLKDEISHSNFDVSSSNNANFDLSSDNNSNHTSPNTPKGSNNNPGS